MKINNKFVCSLAAASMVLMVAGCGGSDSKDAATADTAVEQEAAVETSEDVTEETNESTEESTEAAEESAQSALTIAEIYEKIKSSYTLPDMFEADADWLMNYYGIDASMLSDYVFAEADEVHADRVIILTVADENNMSEVEEKLNSVLEQLSSPEMLDYLPDQADMITSSEIKKNGNTLYLVISPDAEGIEEIIESSL